MVTGDNNNQQGRNRRRGGLQELFAGGNMSFGTYLFIEILQGALHDIFDINVGKTGTFIGIVVLLITCAVPTTAIWAFWSYSTTTPIGIAFVVLFGGLLLHRITKGAKSTLEIIILAVLTMISIYFSLTYVLSKGWDWTYIFLGVGFISFLASIFILMAVKINKRRNKKHIDRKEET